MFSMVIGRDNSDVVSHGEEGLRPFLLAVRSLHSSED